MGSAAWQWLRGVGGRRGSRPLVAGIVLALHAALLLFFFVAPSGVTPPLINAPAMMVSLIEQPRGRFEQADRPAINPHLLKRTLQPPDMPPEVRIEIPVETPPLPQPAVVQASLSPGISKDVPGEGASRGITDDPGDGAGREIVHRVAPVYSKASAAAHEQGVVALRVLVDEQGRPSQVRLAQGSGFARLDQSAADAVQQYLFTPPAPGKAGQSWTTVRIEFVLLPQVVPTSVIGFDSVVIQQVTAARHSGYFGDRPAIMVVEDRVDEIARRLLESLARSPAVMSAEQDARRPPAPFQLLARLGRLKFVRFIGFAAQGFDCGMSSPRQRTDRCAIFEARQMAGISYWLAAVGDDGVFKSMEIMAATQPPPGNHQPD